MIYNKLWSFKRKKKLFPILMFIMWTKGFQSCLGCNLELHHGMVLHYMFKEHLQVLPFSHSFSDLVVQSKVFIFYDLLPVWCTTQMWHISLLYHAGCWHGCCAATIETETKIIKHIGILFQVNYFLYCLN